MFFQVVRYLTPALAVALLVLTLGLLQAAESYEDYALRLTRNPPEGVRFRPDLEAYLSKLAIRERSRHGRPPLTSHTLMRPAARAQALEMLIGNFVGHESKSGFKFAQRFEAFAGPGDHGRHGENAARDRQSDKTDKYKATALFQQWLDSTGHRRNMLHRDFNYVSTGVVQKGHHIYAVQIYWER